MHTSLLKISIITVSYNAEKSIGRTLDSVARQTYPNVEHILIDGASLDGTMSIVSKLGQHLAHSISEPDKGIYDAMNKGLAISTGDIIAFLNADDFYASNDVLELVAQIMGDKRINLLSGNVAYFNADCDDKIVRLYDSSSFKISKLRIGLMPAHPALFMSRKVLNQAGGFKSDYRIAGDFELIARVFTHQNIVMHHLNKVLVNMQIGGISTLGWRMRLLINKEILRACSENGIKTNALLLLLRYPRKLMEFRWR